VTETLLDAASALAPESATRPKDQYKTPRPLVKKIEEVFGVTFGLDLCAAPHSTVAPAWHGWQADGRFIDALDPSLAWGTRHGVGYHAWCNPPYSAGMVLPFVDRAIAEVQKGNILSASFLVQNDCSTEWYWRLFEASARKLDLAPRVVFLDANDKPADAGARVASTVLRGVPSLVRPAAPRVELCRWSPSGRAQPRRDRPEV
jgi:hypothetical protein